MNSTEMFLRRFGSLEAAPATPAENAVPAYESWPGGLPPGAPAKPPAPVETLPVAETSGASGGEFTRLFVRPTPSGEHERLTPIPDAAAPRDVPRPPSPLDNYPAPGGGYAPPTQAAGPPASSASQFFSREFARTPVPPPRGDSSLPGTREGQGYGDPPPAYRASARSTAPEVEELRRSLSEGQAYPERGRDSRDDLRWPQERAQESFREPAAQLFPHEREEYGAAPSPPASSVTIMLDRLSLDQARASLSQPLSPAPAALPPERPAANAGPASGPGEYTRVFERIEMGSSAPQAAPQSPPQVPPQAPPQPAWPAAAVQPFHPPAVPAVPPVPVAAPAAHAAFASYPVAAPVRPEPPRAPAAAPVPAAPKSKLQEMLPLLLIANAFLMLVLIVVVVFALRART